MFSLVKKVATSAKPAARRTPAQSRLMSGHAPPPAEGSFEAKVRAVLPEDYQVGRRAEIRAVALIVLATLGAYTSLILFFKLLPSSKKDEIVIRTCLRVKR
ncbi:hypothetical protein BBJ28_00007342 [Nothophytophthora sp. Chile5]|nr:hypothetical protein BBJ28_00007342 [Nothophytophthora sp. Chile5]